MDKKDLLLKNFSILAKDLIKNYDAIKSIVEQLLPIDPQMVIRCWHDIIFNNIDKLQPYFGIEEYPYDTLGYDYVLRFLNGIMDIDDFKYALDAYANDRALLEVLYTQTFFEDEYRISGTGLAVNYLLKHNKLQQANNILSAIYKNKTFSLYPELWRYIIDRFKYSDPENYSGGGWMSDANFHQEKPIQDFCMSWGERIINEEQQAGAMAYILRIF